MMIIIAKNKMKNVIIIKSIKKHSIRKEKKYVFRRNILKIASVFIFCSQLFGKHKKAFLFRR